VVFEAEVEELKSVQVLPLAIFVDVGLAVSGTHEVLPLIDQGCDLSACLTTDVEQGVGGLVVIVIELEGRQISTVRVVQSSLEVARIDDKGCHVNPAGPVFENFLIDCGAQL
jgi:hypothetical protein